MNTPTDLERRARAVERRVGHPLRKWEQLETSVQQEQIEAFAVVEPDWLDIMWSLDAYRVAGVPPRGMGKPTQTPPQRLAGAYRKKGNWFATLLALLLSNQTSQHLAPRVRIEGFSQTHQIDVAWPARGIDPLVCVETKVTGAPAYGDTPARKCMADWSNRRKELKFASTDLKLFRRQHLTAIRHWGDWRRTTPPATYFLWAARMAPKDDMPRMVNEVQALVNTYLEGAGIVAWQERSTGSGYEPVALPTRDRVSTIDDVLYLVASEVRRQAPRGKAPPPQVPAERAVDPETLEDDRVLD